MSDQVRRRWWNLLEYPETMSDCGHVWTSRACPSHAMCINDLNNLGSTICSCGFYPSSKSNGADGQCEFSHVTYAYLAFWLFLCAASVTVGVWFAYHVIRFKRIDVLKRDTLGIASAWILICSFCCLANGITRCIWLYSESRDGFYFMFVSSPLFLLPLRMLN